MKHLGLVSLQDSALDFLRTWAMTNLERRLTSSDLAEALWGLLLTFWGDGATSSCNLLDSKIRGKPRRFITHVKEREEAYDAFESMAVKVSKFPMAQKPEKIGGGSADLPKKGLTKKPAGKGGKKQKKHWRPWSLTWSHKRSTWRLRWWRWLRDAALPRWHPTFVFKKKKQASSMSLMDIVIYVVSLKRVRRCINESDGYIHMWFLSKGLVGALCHLGLLSWSLGSSLAMPIRGEGRCGSQAFCTTSIGWVGQAIPRVHHVAEAEHESWHQQQQPGELHHTKFW